MIIDKKLWDDMRHTLSGISMPLVSHQQVQNLLNHVEQQSQGSQLEGHDIKTVANGEAHVR
jgi:hypothetical protein